MFGKIIKNFQIPGGLTHIAGPPKSGKTTLIYHLCNNINNRSKAIIIDAGLSFNAHRLLDLSLSKELNIDNILILRPTSSFEQIEMVMNLHSLIPGVNCTFIALDGFTNYFRKGYSNSISRNLYHSIALQLAYLRFLSQTTKIPILLTNQVSINQVRLQRNIKAIAQNILDYFVDNYFIISPLGDGLWSVSDTNDTEYYYSLSSEGIKTETDYNITS